MNKHLVFYRLALPVVLFAASVIPGFALPEYMEAFRKDPFRRPGVDGCLVCHINPEGGDERNIFGQAFEAASAAITPMLRAQFPDQFAYPVSRVGETVVVHFADPENKQLVIETGGKKYLADLEKRIAGDPATVASAPQPVSSEQKTAIPETPLQAGKPGVFQSSTPMAKFDAYAREGAIFGMQVVNLPNGKPIRRGGVDFWISHRFTFPIFSKGSTSNFFGFDSFAIVGFGVRTGITDRISVAAMRSNMDRTIELSSTVQLARQSTEFPASLQFRIGVEGRDNFQERFSPFIQVVSAKSFADRVSLVFVPSIAFNTRNEKTFLPPQLLFGRGDYTAALGLGAALRVRPSVSVVGEYISRVKGFRGEVFDRPALSIAIQKATYRHTFEFVLSTGERLTTSQYLVNGTDKLKVGFNIFRRLR